MMRDSCGENYFEEHPIFYRVLILTGITLSVVIVFRYLFVYLLPFVLAYLFMRMLFPIIRFLRRRWRFPGWLAYGGTLVSFFLAVTGVFTLLAWQLGKQFRLLLGNIRIYGEKIMDICCVQVVRMCDCVDRLLKAKEGTSELFFYEQFYRLQDSCEDVVSRHAGDFLSGCLCFGGKFFMVLLLIVVSMVALCKDMQIIHKSYRKSKYYPVFHRVALALKESGMAYLKSQGLILLVIWLVCSMGLMLIRNPYALLLGLFISVFDTLPILGSGMIFVPWGIFEIVMGQYYQGVVLLALWFICTLVRKFLEAHFMGNYMGLLPFFMTASIYLGICLFGVWGIFLGPFAVILIRAIYQEMVTSG